MSVTTYDTVESPLGLLLLVADDGVLVELGLDEAAWSDTIEASWAHDPGPTANVRGELGEYFAGRRQRFSAPVEMRGTPFQLEVWNALTSIPYGKTATYGEIAMAVGRPKASRAIGRANHVNPLPIVIPCHRVIGADGSLTGYGGGVERKALLLDLERRLVGARDR
ncbi:MAG TPA: methylated-DNA--[protein]-cysteine S-methyltransferase [Acidimicrobiales bacterium]|jgi:methylated-DNA-[protein]-cysteine S-methyltransferase|nr:methylated-DNA--[protein]-cysteine S-methyltransferase [Acidimicrobiales bacterium]